MDDLIFATHNSNKVAEVRALSGMPYHVISLDEIGLFEDIPEPHHTLEANAREKAETIYRLTGKNCFAEDTGLEVEALNGEPGVFSARYAGLQKSSENNIKKLLGNMKGRTNRNARFRTIISLFINGKETLFEGICEGKIMECPHGEGGFGYDPVFAPIIQGSPSEKTFAEMSIEEKSKHSHRTKAFEKLIHFLSQSV